MSAVEVGLGEIGVGQYILHQNQPYEVLQRTHTQLGRGKGLLSLKLKNLLSGEVKSLTLKGNQTLTQIELRKKKAQFLYRTQESLHFLDENFEEIRTPLSVLGEPAKGGPAKRGEQIKFLKPNQEVSLLFLEKKPLKIELPIKVDLAVQEAPEAIRGDTAKAKVTKEVALETGAHLQVPLFIKTGDIVRVNTETGEYVERLTEKHKN